MEFRSPRCVENPGVLGSGSPHSGYRTQGYDRHSGTCTCTVFVCVGLRDDDNVNIISAPTMPPSAKRRRDEAREDGRDDQSTRVSALAAAARRSRASLAQDRRDPLHDQILEALERGTPLPSSKQARGAGFQDVEDEACFGDACGVEFIDQMRLHQLQTSAKGRTALKAIAACEECDEDMAHWDGPHGELLDAIISDACPPRIHVAKACSPFNPVCLLTPPSEEPLCAVAAENIRVGEPIAPYLGELCLAGETSGGVGNTYLYELSQDEMRARGFQGDARLRVDASRCGAEARFINDKWAPGGLPTREANCYVELVFDGETKQFLLIFFASRRIRKGDEIIADCVCPYSRSNRPPSPQSPCCCSDRHRPRPSFGCCVLQTGRTTGKLRARRCCRRTAQLLEVGAVVSVPRRRNSLGGARGGLGDMHSWESRA